MIRKTNGFPSDLLKGHSSSFLVFFYMAGLENQAKDPKPDNCDRDAAYIQAGVIIKEWDLQQNSSNGLEEKKRKICEWLHNSPSVVLVSYNKNVNRIMGMFI